MAQIGSRKHAFNQKSVISLHTSRHLITELLLESTERACIDNREPPETEILQCAHTISNWIIRCEADIMEARNDRTEASKAIRPSDESMTVSHAKALLEDCAVTIRVNFKLHSH